MGKLTQYLEYKKAQKLMKKIEGIKKSSLYYKVRIEESISYGTRLQRTLIVDIDQDWVDQEILSKILLLIMEECVKYKLSFFGYYDKNLQIKINCTN